MPTRWAFFFFSLHLQYEIYVVCRQYGTVVAGCQPGGAAGGGGRGAPRGGGGRGGGGGGPDSQQLRYRTDVMLHIFHIVCGD